jgi:dihydrolipoamide dehydrogenase
LSGEDAASRRGVPPYADGGEVIRTIHARASADSNGHLARLSDGERLTGAHAPGREAAASLQQAALAIRARVPLDILRDTTKPLLMFSKIYLGALIALHGEIATAQPVAEVAS